QAQVLGAALAGRHAAHDLGAVVQHLLGGEAALRAGEALDDDFRTPVDEDGHLESMVFDSFPRLRGKVGMGAGIAHGPHPPSAPSPASGGRTFGDQAAAAATAFLAPSLMSLAAVIASPEFFSNSLPASTLVPSRRTITGTLTSTSL